MGHYNDPFDWDYSDHPEKSLVRYRCIRLGSALLGNPAEFVKHQYSSTLLGHKYIFRQFTPRNFPWYAGNYRGADFDVLKDYHVVIQSDSKVGEPPKSVKAKMSLFDSQFLKTIDVFEAQFKLGKIDQAVLRVKLAEAFGILLVRFLTIHPYANGNGHVGRLLVLTMLGRLGIQPVEWTIDDRPPYSKAIHDHRRGNTKPLTEVLMKCFYG